MANFRRYGPKKKIFYRLTLALLLILGGFYLSLSTIRPTVLEAARFQGKKEAEKIIFEESLKEISSVKSESSPFVKITRNEETYVTSIETDSVAISALSYRIALSVIERLTGTENEAFYLCSGSLTGNPYLAGRGPRIPFKIETGKYLHTEIKSEFVSAGINQTLHKLGLSISVDVTVFLAGWTTAESIEVLTPLCETVIVGEVPQSFSDLSFLGRSYPTKNEASEITS